MSTLTNYSDITLTRTQLYFPDIDIHEVFDRNPTKYVFRHTDCPYVFITDGDCLYAQDQDERGIDPVSKYGLYNIMSIYNDFTEFLDSCKHIESVLGRELFLADRSGGGVFKCSIRHLELQHISKLRNNDEPTN